MNHFLVFKVTAFVLCLILFLGYHFANGPYVEYNGDIPANERTKALEQIQQEMDVLIKQGRDKF